MTASEMPPAALPVRSEHVPAELKALDQWVAWRWEPRPAAPGEWTKVPINPRTGTRASAIDPRTWAAFEDALAYAARHGLPGIGFVVTRDDPFVGGDLDKCRDPRTGALEPWAAEIVAELDSYAEVSPSGTGVRVWIIGTLAGLLPDGKEGTRRGPIEVYGGARYFTVTGHRLPGERP